MDKTKVLCEATHPCTMDRYGDTKPEQTVISVVGMLAVKKKYIKWNTFLEYSTSAYIQLFLPALLDFIFSYMDHHRSPRQYFGDVKREVSRHELSLCASKFSRFTQFYLNIKALKSFLSSSPERQRDRERERERERVSESVALAPDP